MWAWVACMYVKTVMNPIRIVFALMDSQSNYIAMIHGAPAALYDELLLQRCVAGPCWVLSPRLLLLHVWRCNAFRWCDSDTDAPSVSFRTSFTPATPVYRTLWCRVPEMQRNVWVPSVHRNGTSTSRCFTVLHGLCFLAFPAQPFGIS